MSTRLYVQVTNWYCGGLPLDKFRYFQFFRASPKRWYKRDINLKVVFLFVYRRKTIRIIEKAHKITTTVMENNYRNHGGHTSETGERGRMGLHESVSGRKVVFRRHVRRRVVIGQVLYVPWQPIRFRCRLVGRFISC